MPRDYFHVSSSLNRESIERHGLDWRLMGPAPGIAGSRVPEEQGIFLVTDEWSVEWFAHMGLEVGHASVDVWKISLPLSLELSDEAEYPLVTRPIPPEAIALHQADWTARDAGAVIGDLLHAIYYGDGSLDSDLLDEGAVVVDVDGRRHQGFEAIATWSRKRAHGPPAPPEPHPDPDGGFVIELGGEGGYTIEGIDEKGLDDEGNLRLVSPPTERDHWMLVVVWGNQVAEVREFRTREEALAASRG